MRNESHYIECLRDDFGNLEAELDRLRALNAKLVEACEETVRMLGADCHLYKAGEKAKAALAEAREPQQPPQGLASDTA
jgi:hypothetical protein